MRKSKPRRRSPQPGSRGVPAARTRQKNEGEGSRTAARNYDRAVAKTVKSGTVPEKARAAARALDGPEGDELRRAEARAKRGRTASDHSPLSK